MAIAVHIDQHSEMNPVGAACLTTGDTKHLKDIPQTTRERLTAFEFEGFAIAVRFPGSARLDGLGPGGAGDGDRDFEPGLRAQQLAFVIRGRGQIYEDPVRNGLGTGVGVDGFAPKIVVWVGHNQSRAKLK